jgi:ketosteroid isomerase-like protein
VTRENVELAHRTIDAFNRRDLDALLAVMDEDVEGAPPLASVEGSYRGHAGIRRWWVSLFSGLPDFAIDVVEMREYGDLTTATLRTRAHGATSQTPVEETLWLVWESRNGKVVWWQTFRSEVEAVDAVRLRK